jgi:hypothetical protein
MGSVDIGFKVPAKNSVKSPDTKKVRYSICVDPTEEGSSAGNDSNYLTSKGIKEGITSKD